MNLNIQGCDFTWKYLEFDNLGKKKPEVWEILKKNLEFLTIFTC